MLTHSVGKMEYLSQWQKMNVHSKTTSERNVPPPLAHAAVHSGHEPVRAAGAHCSFLPLPQPFPAGPPQPRIQHPSIQPTGARKEYKPEATPAQDMS